MNERSQDATRVVSDAPAEKPPLMLVYPRPLSMDQIRNIEYSLDLARGSARVAVIEGCTEIYQFLDGRWEPLRPGVPDPASVPKV